MKTYIGIDNGVSGSIAIISDENVMLFPTPTTFGQDYTKTKKSVSRVDHTALKALLLNHVSIDNLHDVEVVLERPMVNPTRFQASASALRALESTLIALEDLEYSYSFIDSKTWQKKYLSAGIKGAPKLKKDSCDRGVKRFPFLKTQILFQTDADALWIALWAKEGR